MLQLADALQPRHCDAVCECGFIASSLLLIWCFAHDHQQNLDKLLMHSYPAIMFLLCIICSKTVHPLNSGCLASCWYCRFNKVEVNCLHNAHARERAVPNRITNNCRLRACKAHANRPRDATPKFHSDTNGASQE